MTLEQMQKTMNEQCASAKGLEGLTVGDPPQRQGVNWLCPVHNGQPWLGVIPPTCTCAPQFVPFSYPASPNVGWECPRCHVCHAPTVSRCECRKIQFITGTSLAAASIATSKIADSNITGKVGTNG